MTSPVSHDDTKLISDAIAKLRSLSQVNILSSWRCCEGDLSVCEVNASDLSSWNFAELNAKGQIAWAGGQKVLWLLQKLIIPQDLQGYPLEGLSLRLALVWWADSAKVYVNGTLLVEGDLFDSFPRVLLSGGVTPGEEFTVALRLVSPVHCDGALVKSQLVYESNDDSVEPGFVADELAIVQRYLECFAPERLDALRAFVEELEEGLNLLGAEEKRKREFEKLFSVVRQKLLESKIPNLKSKIFLLGHAHLDLAWLWRVDDTWEAAQRTFESVLRLQQDFPELIFCHSTPALYAWIEERRPDLFGAIQRAVADGLWEVVGGFWVEPELNLIAGESIVRQLLYGQRYVLEKFGRLSTVVWVPDSFGFCATLPQFLVNGGVEYFVTQKLRWNDTTRFEYGAFWWRSPDGSEVFSYMSALIGEGIDPVKMVSYACEWLSQTGLVESLWLPGVGDHGGGPTRDMLETARRWQNSPIFPDVEFCTSESYLQQIKAKGQGNKVAMSPPPPLSPSPPPPFPTWEDELYLEFHRGCYTTHGDQKRWNRHCEGLLYQAELFAAWATLSCEVSYPKNELESAWKKVLFNQFHDILPGTSISPVYTDVLPTWQEVERVGGSILQQSLNAIASQTSLPTPPQREAQPIVIFNSLNWVRSQVVEIEFPEVDDGQNLDWTIYNLDGHEVESQICFIGFRRKSNGDEIPLTSVLFFASDIPACGYLVFWLCPCKPTLQSLKPFEEFVLENEYLRVTIDSETGDLSGVFDKTNQREVLSGLGNQLQAFQDRGQYWDAWNIDPNYAQHPLPPAELLSIHHLERGTLRTRVRVVRRIGQSTFSQDYILEKASAVLKIANKVNWQENHVLVKVAFPLNLEADFATYEIPCGAIRRTTKPTTPAEKAKWEVPALRWADLTSSPTPHSPLSTPQFGVSLLNDCKYGYDSQPNQLRLTLLRSPDWPNPEADRGYHEFTYALYPHADSWETAHTVRRGYELNLPLQVLVLNPQQYSSKGSLSPSGSLLNLSNDNLILMAFKQSEDDPEQWILRCYECHGKTAELRWKSDLGLTLNESVDLLERSLNSDVLHTVKPWKIVSFKIGKKEFN